MTVTVVIPCYNHARFLREAVDSALAQTQPPAVIVVDDGSSDESAAIASSYTAVRVIRQENRGLAEARNAGLRAATSDAIIFLDADDRLRPDAVRNGVAALKARPDAMLAAGRCMAIDTAGRELPTPRSHAGPHAYEELLRQNFIWMTATAIFRREVFSLVGEFDRRVNPSADYDMYLRIARRFPIVTHDEVVADYRQHGANMSGNPTLMFASTMSVMRAQRPFVAVDVRLVAAYEDGVARWRAFYGEQLVDRFRRHLHAGQFTAAARDGADLVRLYPDGAWRHAIKKLRLMLTTKSTKPA
jgi:glycosyltransferase involved in cell wall biosynthesis